MQDDRDLPYQRNNVEVMCVPFQEHFRYVVSLMPKDVLEALIKYLAIGDGVREETMWIASLSQSARVKHLLKISALEPTGFRGQKNIH